MAINLVSIVTEFLTPEMIGRMASALGIDRGTAQTAVNGAVPSLLAAFSKVAAQPGGAQKLVAAVGQQNGILENLSQMTGTGSSSSLMEAGSQMLSSLLGSQNQNALSGAIGRFAGMSQGISGSFLGMLAPVVLGAISRQLGTRLDPSAITSLLSGQKDNIAAALPSGFANQLAGTGLLDSLGDVGRKAAAAGSQTMRASVTATQAAGDATRRAAAAPASMSWLYWLIPAAAVAALLIFLVGRPTEQAAEPGKTVGQAVTVTTASLDINKQVTDTISSLRTTLGGITDAASARAALPKLQDAVAQVDKLNGLTGQLPADQRKAVASVLSPTMPTLNQLLDKVVQIPGAPDELKPMADALKTKLAALAA